MKILIQNSFVNLCLLQSKYIYKENHNLFVFTFVSL